MIFDLDENMLIENVIGALENAGSRVSELQFNKILNAINDGMPGVVQILAQGMAEHWQAEAINASGWGAKYANAIKYEVNGNEAEVFIDESMIDKTSNKPNIMYAMMMERGVKSWSIKDALLASDKVKEGPDGIRYITIPFPVATPRKKGQGNAKSSFGGREMSNEIYKIVKSGGKIPRGTTTTTGLDISGLTRFNTRQRHSQYGIFRRVSDKSQGWIYPGVAPTPVFSSVLQEVNKKVGEVVSSFLQAIVKEYTE